MYCKACGKQIPDDSAFCNKCGASQKQIDADRGGGSPRWEYCEIEEDIVKGGVFGTPTRIFWAKAIGPKGPYNAGESDAFKAKTSSNYYGVGDVDYFPETNDAARDALRNFVNKLSNDGWDLTEKTGRRWFNYHFRRRVK